MLHTQFINYNKYCYMCNTHINYNIVKCYKLNNNTRNSIIKIITIF